MARLLIIAAISLLCSSTCAHTLLAHLLVNNTKAPAWQYVRNVHPVENPQKGASYEFGQAYPHRRDWVHDLDNGNFTCGRNAHLFASKTETATVVAGDKLGFRLLTIPDLGAGYKDLFIHEGPGHVYMAKVPENETLETWHGKEGDWFKIENHYALNATHWALDNSTNDFNFTIPATTPPGKYLIRVETFGFFPSVQWYPNCAHVEIMGPGGGTPSDFVKFPGAYTDAELDLLETGSFFVDGDHTLFPGIGPKVWTG